MANLVLNASLSVSPTVGLQPALNQTFSTTLSVGTYAEAVVTPGNTAVLLSTLVGPVGTTSVRLRNITPATVSGTAIVTVLTGATVLATLAVGQELVLTGALVAPLSVQQTGTAAAGLTQLYVLSAT